MKHELKLRKLERGDEEGLVDIYRDVFNVELGVDYWRWKYYENPLGEHSMYVALDGERIVGEVGAILCRCKVGAEEMLASQIVDIVIRRDYQKGGPFFDLVKLAREDLIRKSVSFSYAVTIKKTYKISTRLLGYKALTPIKRFVKVIDPSPYLKTKMGALGSVIGGAGKVAMKMSHYGHLKESKQIEIKEITSFDEKFDELWERESRNYEITTVRRSIYLNWRYIDSFLADYKVFAACTDNVINGFMVLSSDAKDGTRKGRIVDIFVEKDNVAAVGSLINKAIEYFYNDGCSVAVTWVPEQSWIAQLFAKGGFKVLDTPHDIVVSSYDDNLSYDQLANPQNWYFTMGDSDYF